MCMCFLLFFLVSSMVKVHGKRPVRIVVVFLIGLHASARMTACCACPGVGFIVISFFSCLFAHARRRQDKQLSHFFCGRSAEQTRTASSWPHYLEVACMCRWNSLDLTTPK